jgi:hypothetical protein
VIHSDYLDLAIGLAVVFFLAGMLVSGLNEGVSWLTRVRSKFLWAYLYDLFNDDRKNRALPRGRAGIMRLWGSTKDHRPQAGGSTFQVTDDDIETTDWLKRLAYALDPIDAPQLTKPGGAPPLTTIKNIPPKSLAQAFLEVFADVGRQDVTRAVATILDRAASPTQIATGIEQLTRRLDLASSNASTAFTTFRARLAEIGFANNATELEQRRAAADTLTTALMPGRDEGPDLRLRDAWRAAAEAWPQGLGIDQVRAVVDATARVFPDSFARLRIETALAKLGANSPLSPTLRRLWESASGEIDTFRDNVESYLDSELQRLSGYYRRCIRVVMFSFAFLVAVVGGIDAISVGRNLWRNPEARSSLVQLADQIGTAPTTSVDAAAPGSQPDEAASTPTTTSGLERIQAECAKAHPPDDATISSPEEAAAAYGKVRTCVGDALDQLTGVGVIDNALWMDPRAWWDDWWNSRFWVHAIGIILTSLALMLGAPFWFDIIKRATGLRKGARGDT